MSRTTCIFTLCLALLGLPALQASVIVNAKTPMRLAAVEEFTWSPCDDLPHPGEIESLSISPDPIPIPGQVIASGVAKTSVPLESPMKLSIIIEKEILGLWVKVPCVDNYGSCTYDLCDILDELFQVGQSCPEPLHTYGVPCHCPILQGTYSVPSSIINIPSLSLPSWLENGHYRLKGTLTIDGAEVGCAKMDASLKSETGSWWK